MAAAKSGMLMAKVEELQAALAALAEEKAAIERVRLQRHSDGVAAKADMSGLSGIRMALGVLREY